MEEGGETRCVARSLGELYHPACAEHKFQMAVSDLSQFTFWNIRCLGCLRHIFLLFLLVPV